MAELVDALVSGISGGNTVGVRVPFWAVSTRAQRLGISAYRSARNALRAAIVAAGFSSISQ